MIVATGLVIAGGVGGMLANTSASVVPEVGKVAALAAATAASSKRGTSSSVSLSASNCDASARYAATT